MTEYVYPTYHLMDIGIYLQRDGYKYVPRDWQLSDFSQDVDHVLATLGNMPYQLENREEGDTLYRMRSIRMVYAFEHYVTWGDCV
ncbi:hypothetical protein GSI_09476 [Ganoderma sinense ZZ0214-1]|uniref:Uncharacterized protein n=1 Tax=Ganoderma sinense ZZ0214-1 TaxID=1077348 RepID=A0A2G8S6Q7_9APHY|nr:hypothetical protein GSI_09476 [Ganoderma sinense ZZ0214-1]